MRKERGLAEEAQRRKHMNPSGPSRCYDIVSEYGRALEENSHMVYGIPWSKLPFNMQDIKAAIIEVALEAVKTMEGA